MHKSSLQFIPGNPDAIIASNIWRTYTISTQLKNGLTLFVIKKSSLREDKIIYDMTIIFCIYCNQVLFSST